MKRILLICIALIFVAVRGNSQTFTPSVSGTIDISTVLNLTVTTIGTSPSFTTISDYQNGKVVAPFATVAAKGNVSWIINVHTQTANFSPMTTGASATMPASKLGVRKSGNTTFLTMSMTSQSLATGLKGPASATGNTFNVDISMNPGFGYAGGLYRINLVYTISMN